MRLYLILILYALATFGQGANLYQQQPKLIQSSQAQALLAQSSSNAAALSSQASSTAQAASIAAATTASIASALVGSGALTSYPYQSNCDSLLDWNQFAIPAWELSNNANFDLWASKQFNNAWVGDLGLTSPMQLQLPSWVDTSSQSQWNVWAQILCSQRNLNILDSLNVANGLSGNPAWLLQNGGGLSSNINGLSASSWLSNSNAFAYNGLLIGSQPSGSGQWSGQYAGLAQNNGIRFGDNGAGWFQDNNADWYTLNSYASNFDNASWYENANSAINWYKDSIGNLYMGNIYGANGYNNGLTSSSVNGVYIGPQPTGSGPWNGQFNGWTQNNGWWYSSNGVGWYQDNSGNWYTSTNNNNGVWSGNGVYVGPQPSGRGPWNGEFKDWTQNNGRWYNSNGVGWYQDNSGNWYTSTTNSNGVWSGNGVYVGPQPSGRGPWNGEFKDWTQNNGWWYNRNGVGWYQDNSGNWYSSTNDNNGLWSGNGVFVGPQPSGLGPWNGQFTDWTQRNGWWYNGNGNGWYQDNNGNWYTTSTTNQLANGFVDGQGAGMITSTQCVSTTVGQMNATLSCPPSTVIVTVLGAAYGNNPGSCPSTVNTMGATCTLNITQLIQKSCQGQNQCSVTVQPNILGAPSNNGQQCSTSMAGPYATTNQYTMVARYTCGIAGPGGIGLGGLNTTSLTFSPPNSASSSSYAFSLILASLLAAMLSIL